MIRDWRISNFKEYIESFNKDFKSALAKVKGDISKVGVLPTPGPVWGYDNILTGLAITVDAVNFTQVYLNDFTIDKNGNYTGHITVKMEDGFGLDVHDVDSKGGLQKINT